MHWGLNFMPANSFINFSSKTWWQYRVRHFLFTDLLLFTDSDCCFEKMCANYRFFVFMRKLFTSQTTHHHDYEEAVGGDELPICWISHWFLFIYVFFLSRCEYRVVTTWPHYLTVLVSLDTEGEQDNLETLWPGSHRRDSVASKLCPLKVSWTQLSRNHQRESMSQNCCVGGSRTCHLRVTKRTVRPQTGTYRLRDEQTLEQFSDLRTWEFWELPSIRGTQ